MLVGHWSLGNTFNPCTSAVVVPVDKKAQHLVRDDGIADLLMFLIRLTKNDDGSTSLRLEQPFHGCRGHRLVARHVLTVQITTGKHLPEGSSDSGDNSHPEKDA